MSSLFLLSSSFYTRRSLSRSPFTTTADSFSFDILSAQQYIDGAMAATSQPISIARDQRSNTLNSSSHLNPPNFQHTSFVAGSPMHISSSSSHLAQQALNYHLANPRFAGTSPRSAESSTSWSIHPGPLFVSAGSLGSTSGSLGASSVNGSTGSYRARMYPGLGCSPSQVLNPLE